MFTASLLDIGDDGMLGLCPDGRKLWLRGPGVPGDEVAFEEEGKRAKITEILSPAADRITPACPHFEHCPGCQLQPLPYERQLELKANKVVETLKRLGGFDEVPFVGIQGSENEYGTRNKLDFTIQGTDLGYRGPEGLVSVETCPVGNPLLTAWISRIREWLSAHPDHRLHRLLLRTNGARDQVHLLLRGEWTPEEQASFLTLAQTDPAAAGVSIQADWKQPWQTVFRNDTLQFELANQTHSVSHDQFFQVHDRLADTLVRTALRELGDANNRTLLDLFCGSGAFTLPATNLGFRAIGIDSRPRKGKAFHRADLRRGLPSFVTKKAWSIVLTDPPRSGMDKGLTKQIRDKLKPRDIVYVSCNPATLARDLKRLCHDAPYTLTRVQAFDLFPQTTHVETVCHLRRVT